MNAGTAENSSRLWKDYRTAFKDWARQVTRLKCLVTSTAGGVDMKEAEHQAQAAELLYRDTRNRLTDDMNLRDEQAAWCGRANENL